MLSTTCQFNMGGRHTPSFGIGIEEDRSGLASISADTESEQQKEKENVSYRLTALSKPGREKKNS